MEYFFYLARCNDDTLYAGHCKEVQIREEKHNHGTGAKYTRARRPIKIVYSEKHNSRSEAAKREYEVKQWPKQKKEDLIK